MSESIVAEKNEAQAESVSESSTVQASPLRALSLHGEPDSQDASSPSMIGRPEPQIPMWRLISLYVSICFGLFLSFLDTSIVATALYTIGVEFQSLSQVNWIALAYTLAYLGCTAIFASLSDLFGRRNTYIAAFTIFIAFSLGCGWAQNLNQLIALRALQGVGGSGLYSIGFVILPEISGLKMMRMIGALAGSVIAMSGILGPLLGGIITNYTTWRWIFWINAPIGIGPLILFALAWPNAQQLQPAERRPLRQMDLLGFFLLIAASIPFVFAFQEAGIHIVSDKNAWSAAIFVAPLVVSIICWIALFGWEYFISIRWAESIGALFPMRLAKSRVYMSAVVATMLTGFPYFVIVFALPIRFQVVNGQSALASGVALLPMLGSSAVGSTVAGAISGKKNNTFPVMMTGAALMLIGTATLSTLDNVSQTQAKAYGLQVFIGFGFGLTISNTGLIAGLESELRDNAVAQGIMAQVRTFGGSIGIATSTAILGVKQRQQLLETGLIAPSQMESLHETMSHFTPDEIHAVRQAFSDAFNETLVVCSIIAGVCLIVTLGCWQKNPITMEEKLKQLRVNEAVRQNALAEKKQEGARVRDLESAGKDVESVAKDLGSIVNDLEGVVKDDQRTEKDVESVVKDMESGEKHVEAAVKDLEEKQKDPEEKQKDPEEKQKDPQEKQKDPQEKQKDPQEKQKDPEENQNDLEGKQQDLGDKLKDPEIKRDSEV